MERKHVFVMLGAVLSITLIISLYCLFFGNQYMITFDSNGGSIVENQLIQVGHKVKEPDQPTRSGYEFVEWQLNGKSFDFSTKVKKKFTLIAQWRKITNLSDILYTVVFDSNGGSEVSSQTVAPGNSLSKPTDPVKDGYTFEGWYNGDHKFDFSKKIMQDITLVARWKKNVSDNSNSNDNADNKDDNKDNSDDKKPSDNKDPKPDDKSDVSSELKVGDRVKIVGEYAESSTSKSALHKRAIGWKRVILKIYEGREYPYRVGNDSGTTGFFKAESLEKIG